MRDADEDGGVASMSVKYSTVQMRMVGVACMSVKYSTVQMRMVE